MITKHPNSQTLLVNIVGNLDALKAEHYRQQLRTLIDEGYRSLIFDMAEAPYVSSSGLGLLVEFFNSIRRIDGAFKLINLSEQALHLLRQARLDSLLLSEAEQTSPGNEQPLDALHQLMSGEILLLSKINEVIEKTLELDDPDAIGRVILNGVMDATRAHRGALYFLNEAEDRLRRVHWISHEKDATPLGPEDLALKIDRAEFRILEVGEARFAQLDELEAAAGSLFEKLGFQKMLIAPIAGQKRRFGLITLEASDGTEELAQMIQPLLGAFTRLCGLALEKVTLVHRVNQQNSELTGALAHLSRSHQSLINAGRLAALGTVISGMAHQLNNKMVPVIGYSQLLVQKNGLPEEVLRKINTIHEAGNEIQQIIEKLLKVSRVRERRNRPMDVNERIGVALDLLSCHIEQSLIKVNMQAADNLPAVLGDNDLFLQALLAILHRSCTSFSTARRDRWIRVVTSVVEGHVRIVVEDNGGDPDEFDNDDWLDPLVPLEAMNHGRIFNYNIPRGVIRRHNGSMTIESRQGGGKHVMIDLQTPIISSQVESECRVA